jgi:hypothetical protein
MFSLRMTEMERKPVRLRTADHSSSSASVVPFSPSATSSSAIILYDESATNTFLANPTLQDCISHSTAAPAAPAAISMSASPTQRFIRGNIPLGRYLRNSLSPFNLAIAEVCARQSQQLNGEQPFCEHKLWAPWIWPEYAKLKPTVEQVIMENEESSAHSVYCYALLFFLIVTPLLVCANLFWIASNYTLVLIIAPPALAMVLLVLLAPVFLQPVDTMVRVLASELRIDSAELLDADRFESLNSTLQTLLIAVLTNATILTTQLESSTQFFSSICIAFSVGFIAALTAWYFSQAWMYRARMMFQAWTYFQTVRRSYNTVEFEEEMEKTIKRLPDITKLKRFIWFVGGGTAWEDSIAKAEAAA